MKRITVIALLGVLVLTSCASVQVAADYDRQADFTSYKTYAFYKEGVDRTPISDLDKKRILKAIEQNLASKGMQLSQNPDVLVNIFTKERENLNVYNNYPGWGWGWGAGWGPFWGGANYSVSSNTEGTLYIEIIDAKKKELIWQGKGVGNIPHNVEAKDKRIAEFVDKIMSQFPPSVQR